MLSIVLRIECKKLPTLYSIPRAVISAYFSKQIQFCLQDWTKDIVGKDPNPAFPSFHVYSVMQMENSACLLDARDSRAFEQCGFSCLPPNLINRWVMPIKQLSAGRQSSLASFKQLQCPSCSRASLCQRGGENATCMNQGAVSQCGPCLFYWRTTGPNSRTV